MPSVISANKPPGQSLLLYSMPKRFNGCSRLAGSQSLLCEQGVDGLPLRLYEARVEAVQHARPRSGVIGLEACDLGVRAHIFLTALNEHGLAQ